MSEPIAQLMACAYCGKLAPITHTCPTMQQTCPQGWSEQAIREIVRQELVELSRTKEQTK